ncbi:MAG TPA: DUF5695 domain-containing protein [Candidatus Acidoferrum sp.]|nr:DUF5695 domain-containing protein [Candidatus Acidoferrum sp.]
MRTVEGRNLVWAQGARLGKIALMFGCAVALAGRAQESRKKTAPTPGPMLQQGFLDLDTPAFSLRLLRSSQTVAALKPKGAGDFDFTPSDLLVERSQDGNYHLGDLDLRVRQAGTSEWKGYSTALVRRPVSVLPPSGGVLAAAELNLTLPEDIPLKITRSWEVRDGALALRFRLENRTKQSVEIGALGIPMIFNNVLTDRSLEQAHAVCSFYDPYIGEDAGYLQVTRLNGHGPALLVIPDGHTPFEAYNPILDRRRSSSETLFRDPTPRGITFEGFYDWMVHSKAYAENEWKPAVPWNPPTELTLAPGETKTYGVRFVTADSIRDIEKTLAANGRPVAVGIPGYILPPDLEAQLFLKYAQPVKTISVEPAGSVTFHVAAGASAGWKHYTLHGDSWGRARVTVTYADDLVQTIQYFVTKPEAQAVADMGHFLTTNQWFTDTTDPFHRAPSIMSYDRDTNQIVKQDSRVWIAGLGDEGGSGSWLATIMKQFVEPDKEELEKFQRFVDGVLWGGLQYNEGAKKFGVRKSLFYYQADQMPAGFYSPRLDWHSWTSWNKEQAERVDRSFNYPHVVAAYWVLYRLARNYDGLVTDHPWDWYLNNAYETSVAMARLAPSYAVFGQMEGDIFLKVLADLRREGMNSQADNLEAVMRQRANHWKTEAYPFGSEMPWDSTGQEEVYAWMKYFGHEDKAEVTLNAILGYDPAIPHWGYNGSARRYWDFIFGGKYRRLERQLHHYGSSLNAIPLLSEYREHPDDFYLLRVGYGGTMGLFANIDQEGFLAPAFHGFPDMLKPDALSGDNGPSFFGHAFNTATYVVHHPEFGWVAFGGNVTNQRGVIGITPADSARSRVYIASDGLWLTLDAGQFQKVEVNPKTEVVRVELAPANSFLRKARLRVRQPAKIPGVGEYHPVAQLTKERDAYVVPLGKTTAWVELKQAKVPPSNSD